MRREKIDPISFRLMRRRALRQATRGFEVCGALIRDENGIITLRGLRNLATEPAKWMIKRSWLRAIRRELNPTKKRLVGTFHSHVGGFAYPSPKDLDSTWSGFLMMIYDTMDRRTGLWMPVIRNGCGRLRAIAVLCDSPKWDEKSATEYAMTLQQKFRSKEKRNQPSRSKNPKA